MTRTQCSICKQYMKFEQGDVIFGGIWSDKYCVTKSQYLNLRNMNLELRSRERKIGLWEKLVLLVSEKD